MGSKLTGAPTRSPELVPLRMTPQPTVGATQSVTPPVDPKMNLRRVAVNVTAPDPSAVALWCDWHPPTTTLNDSPNGVPPLPVVKRTHFGRAGDAGKFEIDQLGRHGLR